METAKEANCQRVAGSSDFALGGAPVRAPLHLHLPNHEPNFHAPRVSASWRLVAVHLP
jgi:hypothetical protein